VTDGPTPTDPAQIAPEPQAPAAPTSGHANGNGSGSGHLSAERIAPPVRPDRRLSDEAAAQWDLVWQKRSTDESPSGRRPRRRGRSDLAVLARGSALSLAGSIASSVLGFALVVVITRGLHPPREAGILLEAIALFTLLSNTAELGADTGLVRMVATYLSKGRVADIRRTIWIAILPVLILSVAASVAVWIFAPQLTRLLIHGANRAGAERYLRLLIPFLPMATAITVVLSGTRGFGSMVPYVGIYNIGIPLARPALVAAAIVGGFGIVAVAMAWSLPVAAGFVLAIVMLFRMTRRRERRTRHPGSPRPIGELTSEFWRFSAPRGLAGFFLVAVGYLDVLLVGALRSTAEAGIYSTTSRFVQVGTFALQAIGLAVAPQIASLLAQGDSKRAERVFQTAASWLVAMAFPMYVTLAVFAPFLLRVFGPAYVSGHLALVLLCVGMLTVVGTGNNKIALLMAGKSTWNLWISGVSLALNIGLNVWLIPTHGMNGAAVAYMASMIWDSLATCLALWLLVKLAPFGTDYALVTAASIGVFGGVGVAVRLLLGMTITSFAIFAVLAVSIYGAMLYLLRRRLHLGELKAVVRRRAMRGGMGSAGAYSASR
jgi:O-antigen/teichoic acid export membrane protein